MTQFNPSPFDDSASFYGALSPTPFEPVDLAAMYPSAEEHLNKGHDLYSAYKSNPFNQENKDSLNEAIAHYRHALDIQPDLSTAYTSLASALWEQGNISLENALHYCELAIQFDPSEVQHYVSQGRFLSESGEYTQAIQHYTHALSISLTPQPDIHRQLSSVYFKLLTPPTGAAALPYTTPEPHQTASTVSVAQLKACYQGMYHRFMSKGLSLIYGPPKTAVSTSPAVSNVSAQARRSFVPFGMSPIWSSLSLAVDALLPTHLQTQYYRWATEHASQHPQLLKSLAKCYQGDGNTIKAIQTYQHAVELNPSDTETHHILALLFRDENEMEHAQLHFEHVIRLNPKHFDALFELGHIHTDKQDYMRALYYFKEATKQTQHHPYLLSNMAYVLFKLGDMEGAVAAYNDALEYGTDPTWRSAVAQTLGALYYQTFDDDEAAKEAFALSMTLDPNNIEAAMMLAELHFEEGDFQSALELYETIEERDAANANVHSHVGYILWQMDRNEDALKAYQKALHLDRENAIVYNNMGVIYLDEMFNGQKSSLMFEKALMYNPNYTLAAFNKGRAHELMGQVQKAAEHYSDALNLNALNPELESNEIESRLHLLFEVPGE